MSLHALGLLSCDLLLLLLPVSFDLPEAEPDQDEDEECQSCLRPERRGEESHTGETSQGLCQWTAQQRRGPLPPLAVLFVHTWIKRAPDP